MTAIIVRIFVLLTIMWLSGCSTPAPSTEHQLEIRIPRSNQQPLVIDLDESRASKAIVARANEILEIDRRLENWRQNVTGNPIVIKEFEKIAIQSREEAVRELEVAWTIATSTSGPLDMLFGRTDESIGDASTVLGTELPSSPSCKTEITAVPEGAYIHYTTEGDYQDGRRDWISYTFGENLNLGHYRFLVSKGDEFKYDQRVLILTDPKVVHLQPTPGDI